MKISKKLERILFALSDPTRSSVMIMLHNKPKYVSEIIKKLKIEPTLLSHHLAVLRDAGLVKSERDGKKVVYTKVKDFMNKNDLDKIFN